MMTENPADIEKDETRISVYESREAFEARLAGGCPPGTRIERDELGTGLVLIAVRPEPFGRPARWPAEKDVYRRDSRQLAVARRFALDGDEGGEVREVLVRVVHYERTAPDGRGLGSGTGAYPVESE